MLRNFKDLRGSPLPPTRAAAIPDQRPQLAAAVLLVEVMRADPTSTVPERDAVPHALRRRFELAEDALLRLIELA